MSKGFKKFPFAWRQQACKLPDCAFKLWTYMWWRSDEKAEFCLAERHVMADLDISRNTLYKAKRILLESNWIAKVGQRGESGKWDLAVYQVLGHGEPQPSTNVCDTAPCTKITDAEDLVLTVDTSSSVTASPIPENLSVKQEEEKEEEGAPFATLTTPQSGNASEQIDQDFEALLAPGSPVALISETWMRHTGLMLLPTEWEPAKELSDHWGLEATLSYLDDTFACPKTRKVAWRNFSFWVSRFIQTKANIDAWHRARPTAAPAAQGAACQQ